MDDIRDDEAVKSYFATHFPDAVPLMPDYVREYQRNPACRLVTVRAKPWAYKDQIVIMGDAAHAMVPFYGQGMNSGFEDVLYFKECLDKFNDDLSQAVPYFAEQRRAKGDAIAQLSMGNYMEMRHHTASRWFLLQKKLEGVLNWLFPSWWVPLYKMVAFTRIPYDEALQRADKQDKLLTIAGRLVAAAAVGGAAVAAVKHHQPSQDLLKDLWRATADSAFLAGSSLASAKKA